MARRKGFGNPLTKAIGRVLDEVAPEVVDGMVDIANGPKKKKKKKASDSESTSSTDWATRAPAAPRKSH